MVSNKVSEQNFIVWEFTPQMGGQKLTKPKTDVLSTIIPLPPLLRLTQEHSCKKIPDRSDDGLRPSLRHSAVDVIFGIVVLLGILGLGREYVLRVELEVLHESPTRE